MDILATQVASLIKAYRPPKPCGGTIHRCEDDPDDDPVEAIISGQARRNAQLQFGVAAARSIGERARRRIFDAILGHEPMSSKEVACAVGMAPKLCGKHLRFMADAGLLVRSGSHRSYRYEVATNG